MTPGPARLPRLGHVDDDPELEVLHGVRCHGADVPGGRARSLLVELALAGPQGTTDARLIELVWGEEPPANPTKALQVQVSRLRTSHGETLLVREHGGYRLGLATHDVDLWRLEQLVAAGASALRDGRFAEARHAAERAEALCPAVPVRDEAASEIERRTAELRSRTVTVLGLATSRCGDHVAALPWLEVALAEHPGDEKLLVATLRSEAAVRGGGPALERYATYREDLAQRTGSDPGHDVQRLHLELLALDRPVREGVHFDSTDLVGRQDAIATLRAMIARRTGDLDRRAGRPRQDPSGARAGP